MFTGALDFKEVIRLPNRLEISAISSSSQMRTSILTIWGLVAWPVVAMAGSPSSSITSLPPLQSKSTIMLWVSLVFACSRPRLCAKGAVSGVLCFPWVPASAGMTWGEGLAYTTTTVFTNVPIPAIDMLTTSPSANVNSGGGIVPVPVQTVVPFGT